MDVLQLQARLARAGYDPGGQDGVAGPRTYGALFAYMAGHQFGDRAAELGRGAAAYFARYEITTALRLAHFIAQAAHETMRFATLHELWGPTPAQRRYETREDLGNHVAGDGFRYRGRGIFQLTGRGNYREYGALLGIALEEHPELAEEPATSVLIACAYWAKHGLNALADRDDVVGITHKINGGENGLAERRQMLARAKAVLL